MRARRTVRRHNDPAPKKRHSRPVERDCGASGKLGFKSKAKAKKDLLRYGGAQASARSVYRCPSCGLWHTSSQRQRRT